MNRKTFLQSCLIVPSLVTAKSTWAQTTSPEATTTMDPLTVQDYSQLRGIESAFYSFSTLPSFGFENFIDGAIGALDSWGITFTRESQANMAHGDFVYAYQQWINETQTYELENVSRASVRDLGEISWG